MQQQGIALLQVQQQMIGQQQAQLEMLKVQQQMLFAQQQGFTQGYTAGRAGASVPVAPDGSPPLYQQGSALPYQQVAGQHLPFQMLMGGGSSAQPTQQEWR